MTSKLRSLLAAISLFAAAIAPASAYVFELSPSSQTVRAGDLVSLQLSMGGVDPAVGLGGYNFFIGFDPALLASPNFVPTSVLGDPVLFESIYSADTGVPGELKLSASSLLSITDLSALQGNAATLVLGTLQFSASAPGASLLSFLDFLAFDSAGAPLPMDTPANASVTITPRQVPEPGTLALVGTALLFVPATRRWRRAY